MAEFALLILAAVIALIWRLAPRIRPRPFPAVREPAAAPERVPLPAAMPAPVERFYRGVYPDGLPLITSAVISGRGTLRVGRVLLTARFRFTHAAGRAYEHRIEAGWLGLMFLRIRERYEDGAARLEFPVGVVENEPKVNQGANLALWAESMWLPAVLLTDPRVRWEPVDAHTAMLTVPFQGGEERFVVRFDPDTGLPALWSPCATRRPTARRRRCG